MQDSGNGKASQVAGSGHRGVGISGSGGPFHSAGDEALLWHQCIHTPDDFKGHRFRAVMVMAFTSSCDSGKRNTVRAPGHCGG